MSLFHGAVIGGVAVLHTAQRRGSTTSCASFPRVFLRNPPCHVAFRSLPALKRDVFRPHLQRAAALPGTCYSPSSSSHQPPTEPHTPHEPRLPAAETLPEQMYRDAHIIHAQTHSTNTHAHAKTHHICPLCKSCSSVQGSKLSVIFQITS